ncbi:4'-phosphopantetheinyl transferase family protein [Micromonospora chokoriensis]
MSAAVSGVATDGAVDAIDCHVWWMDATDAPDWCEELLSEPERARADSFRQVPGRRRFAAATALLKVAVAGSVGCDPFDVKLRRECPDCRRLHGRPEVVGGTPNVSLSHSADLLAVALCADGPVGVDVEQVNPDVDMDGMLRFVFGDAERGFFDEIRGRQARLEAFFQCWTRKESVLKATGDGLRVPMSNVTLEASDGHVRLAGFTNRPELVEATQIVDLQSGPGYVGAVTVLSTRPVRVWQLDGADAFTAAAELVRDRSRIAVR